MTHSVVRLALLAFLAAGVPTIACAQQPAQPPAQQVAQAPNQPEQQEEFVPVGELPPQDQLPAAPLLIAAYAFVLVALFVYIISVSRRMGTVQREIERLESDFRRTGRS